MSDFQVVGRAAGLSGVRDPITPINFSLLAVTLEGRTIVLVSNAFERAPCVISYMCSVAIYKASIEGCFICRINNHKLFRSEIECSDRVMSDDQKNGNVASEPPLNGVRHATGFLHLLSSEKGRKLPPTENLGVQDAMLTRSECIRTPCRSNSSRTICSGSCTRFAGDSHCSARDRGLQNRVTLYNNGWYYMVVCGDSCGAVQGWMAIFKAPRLLILSNAFW